MKRLIILFGRMLGKQQLNMPLQIGDYMDNEMKYRAGGGAGGGGGGSGSLPCYTIKMPDGRYVGLATGSFSSVQPYLLAGGQIINYGNSISFPSQSSDT